MALDEALATAVGRGVSPPTFRLYGWQAPTLSLGYAQPWRSGPDPAACRRHGIEVVRRPTGGRAVLHAAEITYSACLPLAGEWGRLSVGESFTQLCAGLVAGVRHLGIAAEIAAEQPRRARRPVACFQLAGMPAITVAGRKLIGSAQRRWNGALLQHGSILLNFDEALHATVFPDWNVSANDRMTCVRTLAPDVTHAAIEAALLVGWSAVLGPGRADALLPEERAHSHRLVQERYGNPEWTFSR